MNTLTTMNFRSKNTQLLILGATSLVCSRTLFSFFDDPEGPNLLVVFGMAVIVYLLSLPAYLFVPSVTGFKKLLLTVAVQVLVIACLYVLLG